MYPESVMEANFDCEAIVGADVVVYTKEKALGRPCIEIVTRFTSYQFSVQWYKRRGGRINSFQAMVNVIRDGALYYPHRIQP